MRIFLLTIPLVLALTVRSQDTLTVMSYNILNYPASNAGKADTLKTIIKHVRPDIFMITELTSGTGVQSIMSGALNVNGVTSYQAATYTDGPDTDNMMFYNSDKLVLYSQHEIPTVLRNISEYVLYYKDPGLTVTSDTVFIYCYMAHLKASSGTSNEQQRNQEAATMKSYMDTRPNIENIILGGDFNLYTSSEPAFSTILNGGNTTLLDPINTPGSWGSNAAFAGVHTQSTRLNNLGDGGAFGGLDDRFDFIFFGSDLPTGANGLTYISGTYNALGNDGNHYNKSINDAPTNSSAPANVIDALYYMSDHLPITLKAYLSGPAAVKETANETGWNVYLDHDQLVISTGRYENKTTLELYDLTGKMIASRSFSGTKQMRWSLPDLRQGMYLVKISASGNQQSFKVVKQ
ncbi:MAG: T9SS type A sorting domain-containing protein [Flavobacteriales bacterium]|nr:T9SS type A sorting domain-containing protein [Flavobacteriales bacterium]